MSNDFEDQRLGNWPGDRDRKEIVEAAIELSKIANQDCWHSFGPDPDKEDPCTCDACSATRAMKYLEEVLYPKVRSISPHRLQHGVRELTLVAMWEEANTRRSWLNGGRGTLELLIEDELGPVTQRDMDVATAVIQWLGTNCGRSFLDAAIRDMRHQQQAKEFDDLLSELQSVEDSDAEH